jgi:hypothetical protein
MTRITPYEKFKELAGLDRGPSARGDGLQPRQFTPVLSKAPQMTEIFQTAPPGVGASGGTSTEQQ